MLAILGTIAIVLVLVILIQISRSCEFISELKGNLDSYEESGKVTGLGLLLFLIFGMIGVVYCVFTLTPLLLPEASSEHGIGTDKLFWTTAAITGIVFVLTNILVFWFGFRYSEKKGQKALYYPDNHKLELIWTVVPSIVLTVLVIMGLTRWNEIFSPAPEEAILVEINAKQFQWIPRYPGLDGELGPRSIGNVTPMNELGIEWADRKSQDDVFPSEIHMVVNRPVSFSIRAQDVLHSFYLPHFRVKMDAVPGIPTRFWFTPTKTTEEMKQVTGNEEFVYELACAELCGKAHANMRMEVIVETQEEYDAWLRTQKPLYELIKASLPVEDLDDKSSLAENSIEVPAEAVTN